MMRDAPELDFEDGRLAVRFGDQPLVTPAQVEVESGMLLEFDPTVPDRLFRLVVTDVDANDESLTQLFGPRAASDLREAVDDFDVPVHLVPTPDAGAWARLALASWHHRWTPLAVPRSQTLIDVAVAASAAGATDLADNAFTEAADTLVRLSRQLLDEPLPGALAGELRATLSAAAEAPAVSAEAREQLARALGTLSSLHVPDTLPANWTSQLPLLVPTGATLSADRSSNRRWYSVDEHQVSPGDNLVDSSDDAVRITITDEDVQVIVTPHPCLRETLTGRQHLLVRFLDWEQGRTILTAFLIPSPEGFTSNIPKSRFGAHDPALLRPDVGLSYRNVPPVVGRQAWQETNRERHLRHSFAALRLATAQRALGVDSSMAEDAAYAHASTSAAWDRQAGNPPGSIGLWQSYLEDPDTVAWQSSGLSIPAATEVGRPLLSELLIAYTGARP